MALAAFAVVNGIFRRSVLEWLMDGDAARLLSTTTLAGAVALAALLWIGTRAAPLRRSELLGVGLLWALATVLFDLGLGLGAGQSMPESLADYVPARGGFFGLVIAAELLSPFLVGRLQRTVGTPHLRPS